MSTVKKLLKKIPLAYIFNEKVKKWQVMLLKNKLNSIKAEKATKIPTYEEAYNILSMLRQEPSYADQDYLPIKINEEIDISIIVPIFNSSKFLKQCLDSLRTQITEYKYQVICVDDGSTDNSPIILEEYSKDNRFIIIHQKNKGHSGARNTALRYTLGRYLMFVDSDDFIDQNYIEVMLNKILTENADIVQGSYKKCNAKSIQLMSVECNNNRINSYSELEKFGGAPWGKVYKTSLWNDISYPENMMFEDTIIFNLVFRRATKIYGTNNTYYMYRIYGENTLDKLQGDSRLIDAVWSVRYVSYLSKRLNLKKNDDYYKFLLGQCSKHIYYRIKGFSCEIQKACFVLMCKVVKEYNEEIPHFTASSNLVLRELESSFMNTSFEKWKLCSDILKKSNG